MVAAEYNKLVKGSSGWWGAYPLIIPVQVGDYFQLNKEGIPVGLGNVFNWPGWAEALPVDSEPVKGSETYSAGCQRETGATAGAGVQIPGGIGADATISMLFGRSAGFVLAYEAATRSHIREIPAAQRSILSAAKQDWWQEDWILVTDVIAAESATLAVATEANSRLEFYANAKIPAGIINVAIADPKLGWTASSWRGSGYTSVCKPGTPLYRCIKVRKGWFGRWKKELLAGKVYEDPFTDNPWEAAS